MNLRVTRSHNRKMTACDEGVVGWSMNWQVHKYTNFPGHRWLTIFISHPPNPGFLHEWFFLWLLRCIHAIPIRSNSDEEARGLAVWQNCSKPASIAIYQNRGAIQFINHQHPPSQQQLLGKIEAQCDLCKRIKSSQRKDGPRPPTVLSSDK